MFERLKFVQNFCVAISWPENYNLKRSFRRPFNISFWQKRKQKSTRAVFFAPYETRTLHDAIISKCRYSPASSVTPEANKMAQIIFFYFTKNLTLIIKNSNIRP